MLTFGLERRRARLGRAAPSLACACAALAAIVALAGCTIESESASGDAGAEREARSSTNPSDADKVDARSYLLTDADRRRIAGTVEHHAAARALLDFWRDVQFQNYPGAYMALSPRLRQAIAYRRFVDGIAPARGLFLIKPRIEDEAVRGRFIVFNLALQRTKTLRQSDQVIGFTLAHDRGGWVIAADPYNLFAVSPPEQ